MPCSKRLLLLAVLTVVGWLGRASPAEATFELRISGTGIATTTFTDPGQALIPYSLSSGGFSAGGQGTSDPFFIQQTSPSFNTTIDTGGSVSYNGSGGLPAQLVIELTRSDFEIASGNSELDTLLAAASITGGVTLTVQSWVNYGPGGNNLYNEAPPGPGIGLPGPSGGLVSTLGAQSYVGPLSGVSDAHSLPGAVPQAFTGPGNPYSLTQRLVFDFSSTGGVISFDYKTTLSNPAPSGLVLGLAGLPVLLLVFLRRRQRLALTV